MSNYVENDNGFFVKVTLFKDQVNKAKWILPFTEETYKQLSRSLGKIPYIDIKGTTPDEHKQYETDKKIGFLRSQGVDDAALVQTIWDDFNTPDKGKKGTVVDIYDIQKGASYGGILNTCELSAELVKDSNSDLAILDFILKIEDENYKQLIRDGKISITPSPSIYGTNRIIDGVKIYDPTQYLDFFHVANVTIPANGAEAKMKGFCEGSQAACKKEMANASVTSIENINTTVTKDNISMSSETPNPAAVAAPEVNTSPAAAVQPESGNDKGFSSEDVMKLFDNLPKEAIAKFDKLSNELTEMKSAYEKTNAKLAELEAKEQERKVNERKSLMAKHIDLNRHFKGDTEKFKAKVDWINKHFEADEDLAVYLAEAFPLKIESADSQSTKKGDQPNKEGAYGSAVLFTAEDFLKEVQGEAATSSQQPSSAAKKQTGWGNVIDFNSA